MVNTNYQFVITGNILTGVYEAAPAASVFNVSECWKVINSKVQIRQGQSPVVLRNSGMLDFLLSQQNTRQGRFDMREVTRVDQGNGKLYSVKVRFYPYQAAGSHTGQSRIYCKVDHKKKAYIEHTYEIGYDHVSEPITFSMDELRCMQEGKSEYELDRMQQHVRTYVEDFATKVSRHVADLGNGFVGAFAGESVPVLRTLPLFRTDQSTINPTGLMMIEEYARQAGSDAPALVGGTLLNLASNALSYSGGSAATVNVQGSNLNQSVLSNTYYDANVASQLGNADNILAISPGALKLATFNLHKGDHVHETDYQKRTTMLDPFYGLEHDVIWNMDDCDGDITYSVQFAIQWGVFGYPSCWNDDPCYKFVKDVFLYKVVCSDADICTIERTPCTTTLPIETRTPNCTNPYEVCIVPCNAVYVISSRELCAFNVTGAGSIKAHGISINGLETAFVDSGVNGYDLAIQGELDAAIIEINTILGANGYVMSATTAVDFGIMAECNIATIELIGLDDGTKIELIKNPDPTEMLTFDASASNATTNGQITAMSWTFSEGVIVVPPDGAPSDPITGILGLVGCYNKFHLVADNLAADETVTLDITDNLACTDQFIDTPVPAEE